MKKRYLIIGVMLAVITAAGVFTFPLWHTAYLIGNLAKSKSLDCQIQITLAQEKLPKEQNQFFKALSWVLGIEEDACLNWQAKGSISEQKVHAEIYCDAMKEPVTEVYISKDSTQVNIRMLYEVLQRNFVEKYPVFGYMIPDWKYGSYISLEQIQEIFQIDLKDMFQQNVSKEMEGKNFGKNLAVLYRMERHRTKDGEWQFETVWNGYQVVLKTRKEKQETNLEISGTDREKSQKITAFAISVSSGESDVIDFPESLMEPGEIAQFQKLWQALRQFTERR